MFRTKKLSCSKSSYCCPSVDRHHMFYKHNSSLSILTRTCYTWAVIILWTRHTEVSSKGRNISMITAIVKSCTNPQKSRQPSHFLLVSCSIKGNVCCSGSDTEYYIRRRMQLDGIVPRSMMLSYRNHHQRFPANIIYFSNAWSI